MYLADIRYRIHQAEGGNIHIRAMMDAFGEFADVLQPACEGSVSLLRRVSHEGRPHGARRVLEGLALLWSVIEKVRAHGRIRPALVYVRHDLFEVPTVFALRLLGARVALEVNALVTDEKATRQARTPSWWIRRWVELAGIRASQRIYSVSGHLKDRLASLGIPADRITVTHNAIHPEDFPEASLSAPHRPLATIGFIGTGHPWHGLSALVGAYSRLLRERPDLRLLIIGPETPALSEALDAHGMRGAVEVTGHLPRARVLEEARRIDVAVLPNNLPHCSSLKVFEYMAMGKAIVAARTPATAEILVDGQTAWLVEPDSAEALHAALTRLLGDPATAERLARSARAHVLEHHTWRQNALSVLSSSAPDLLPS
jgi:glycosyltransferase involved in cell wall biosynthesis